MSWKKVTICVDMATKADQSGFGDRLRQDKRRKARKHQLQNVQTYRWHEAACLSWSVIVWEDHCLRSTSQVNIFCFPSQEGRKERDWVSFVGSWGDSTRLFCTVTPHRKWTHSPWSESAYLNELKAAYQRWRPTGSWWTARTITRTTSWQVQGLENCSHGQLLISAKQTLA